MHCSKCTLCAFATESCRILPLRWSNTNWVRSTQRHKTQTEVVEEKCKRDTKGKFRFIKFCEKMKIHLILIFFHWRQHRRLSSKATSMRQSAVWGMRSFQASFPRVKDRFIYEEIGERGLILKLFVFLFNYRSNKVGINQIQNTYLTSLQLESNVFVN